MPALNTKQFLARLWPRKSLKSVRKRKNMSQKIEIFRGDTYSRTLTIKRNGVAIDITGYEIKLTVRPLANIESLTDVSTNADAVISVTATLTTPLSGIATITITSAQTNIAPGQYAYDIQMKDTVNAITTIVQDTFNIKADVTRGS